MNPPSRILAICCGLVAWLAGSGAARAQLRLHPDNPRYLQDVKTGAPILITSHGSIAPTDSAYDYTVGIADLAARQVPYARVWHLLTWATSTAVWPWVRSDVPGAYLGGNKYDLDQFGTDYFIRMGDALTRARDAGILAEIHLFERCSMSPPSWDRWGNNPWASDNNINQLELPPAAEDGTPEFYLFDQSPRLRARQELYLRKLLDETVSFENLIYEIENEHWDHDDPAYADHWARFVKDHLATVHGVERVVSYNSLEGDLEAFYTRDSVDIVNKHYGGEPEANPTVLVDYLRGHWQYGKPINIDEFANGLGDPDLLRRMCWTIVTCGGHFHIEDPEPAARAFDLVENFRLFKGLSGWDFVHAAPDPQVLVSGTGTCMHQAGTELVCTFEDGATRTLAPAAGSYRLDWWDPRQGGFTERGEVQLDGTASAFTPPDDHDWVLQLHQAPHPERVLLAPAAPVIAIDGDPAEWSLEGPPLPAGEPGVGEVAVIGFDGPRCRSAGHYLPGQFPPENAADLSAQVTLRHDREALYLLARIQDSEVHTPDPPASNWVNDCLEIYLDPGHDRGGQPLSASTSDVQLVVDVAGQVNVYAATPDYAARVLSGVQAAARREGGASFIEIRIAKGVLEPALGVEGEVGLDLVVRDNDGPDAASTLLTFGDPVVSSSFPTKIPAHWVTLRLQPLPAGDGGADASDAGQDAGADPGDRPGGDGTSQDDLREGGGGCGCGPGGGGGQAGSMLILVCLGVWLNPRRGTGRGTSSSWT
jgi:hypothetical protein